MGIRNLNKPKTIMVIPITKVDKPAQRKLMMSFNGLGKNRNMGGYLRRSYYFYSSYRNFVITTEYLAKKIELHTLYCTNIQYFMVDLCRRRYSNYLIVARSGWVINPTMLQIKPVS